MTGGTDFVYRLKQIDNDGKYEYSKEVEVEVVPKEINLLQNYPNPFNPVTEIKFTLPEATRVTLRVYNIIGQEVASLVNGVEEAGFHSVKFEGSNLAERDVHIQASGRQFCTDEKDGAFKMTIRGRLKSVIPGLTRNLTFQFCAENRC